MREQQRLNLERYKRRLYQAQLKAIVKDIKTVESVVSDAVKVIGDIPAPVITVDNSGIVDAIKAIEIKPNIKIGTPHIAAPTVVVNNEDIYARYKRVNSEQGMQGLYHGFADSDGNWFIQLESSIDNGPDKSRYFVGKGDFANNWPKKEGFAYKPIYQVGIP